jgi:hypothetical protein
MPITVSWGNPEKTYTCFKFTGKWTWEDYYHSIDAGFELVKDLPYTVNILIDITESNLFPSNILTHFGASTQKPPRPFDLAVVVSDSGFVRAIAQMLNKLYGRKSKFKVVQTLEEAYEIFREHDKQQHPPALT